MQHPIVMKPDVIEEEAVVVDIDVNELTEIATEDTIEPIVPRRRAQTWTPSQGVTTTQPAVVVGVMLGSKRSPL